MEATTQKRAAPAAKAFDVEAIRKDFPALHQEVYDGAPLAYLDNAATTQKPQAVIDRLRRYYARENSNVHRGVHALSQRATDAYEAARRSVARLIGASDETQLVFTRGTTEAVNLVAATFGRRHVGAGDEVVISAMEHHSNIVPWQLLCEEKGARLRVIPVTEAGEIDLDAYRALLTERTKLVALVHVSNTLGTINPIEEMAHVARERGIPVLVDGAQALPHVPVDVEALGADFYCFSGHKMFGPTGIGGLWGRRELLEKMPPYQGGGDMIDEVTFEKTTFAGLPHRLEAGPPPIAGAIGLGAAAEYLLAMDRAGARRHEDALLAYATDRLADLGGIRFVGTASEKTGACSFLIDGVHPYDAGTILDRLGVAVRTGHHCTQPLMERYGIPGTVRASLAFYNTRADVDRLMDGVRQVKEMLG